MAIATSKGGAVTAAVALVKREKLREEHSGTSNRRKKAKQSIYEKKSRVQKRMKRGEEVLMKK